MRPLKINNFLYARSELTQFLEEQRDSAVRRGESDPAFGAEFKYSAHTGELVVGTVYLRIYNSNPTFPLEDPKSFVVDLLQFLQVSFENFSNYIWIEDIIYLIFSFIYCSKL